MEGPDDEPADVCRDDLDTGETIQALVNHARAVEGMELPEGVADPGEAWDRMTKGHN